MTADVMPFTGRRVRPPMPHNAQAAAKVPPAPAAITRLSPEREADMRVWAEERLRDGIRMYRIMFSPEELAKRLMAAAEAELHLIEIEAAR